LSAVVRGLKRCQNGAAPDSCPARRPRASPSMPPRLDRLARAARLSTAAVRSRAVAAAAATPARRPSPSRHATVSASLSHHSPPSPVRWRRVVTGLPSSAAAPCVAVLGQRRARGPHMWAAPRAMRLGRERFRPSCTRLNFINF
jgi:hypothetical protein